MVVSIAVKSIDQTQIVVNEQEFAVDEIKVIFNEILES